MKYLCLVYSDEEQLYTLPESPKDADCLAYAGWLPIFAVADIEAAKEAATANGGTIIDDIQEIPGGEFALCCTDPCGTGLGLVGPKGG